MFVIFVFLLVLHIWIIIFIGTKVRKNVTKQQAKSGAQGFLCAGKSIPLVKVII